MVKIVKSSTVTGFLVVFTTILVLPGLSPAWSLSEMNEDELSDISAQEGLAIDFDGQITMENIIYTDSDGNASGNAGEIQLGDNSGVGVAVGSISNSDGNLTAGNVGSVNLTGMTVDSDGAIDIGGSTSGGVVVGMPNGSFDVETDNIFVGDPSSTSNTFQVQMNGINVSNTTIEVGAN